MAYIGSGLTRFNTADDLTVTDDATIQGGLTVDTTTLVVDDANNRVGIGTPSPSEALHVNGSVTAGNYLLSPSAATVGTFNDTNIEMRTSADGTPAMIFRANGSTERMRIDSSGNLLVGKTARATNTAGIELLGIGASVHSYAGQVMLINRLINDGSIVGFAQAGTTEGTISVSGSTVTLNGAHLSRWSRLTDDSKDASILRGTVMTNLDEMVVWSHDAVEAQDAVYETVVIPAEYDEDGNELTPETTEERLVSEAVEAKEAYTEDNEQLNKMAVSSIEGDPNVAGVFSNWDDEDDFNDLVVAMTGDFVIRIAQGTTVARGDLLMSAGDGTAKPQDDDIVRSKTIAKVTSTHVSHTYDDGSYLVPCVLMAC